MLMHRCDVCGELIEAFEQFAELKIVQHNVPTQSSTILRFVDSETKDDSLSADLCKKCTARVLEILNREAKV